MLIDVKETSGALIPTTGKVTAPTVNGRRRGRLAQRRDGIVRAHPKCDKLWTDERAEELADKLLEDPRPSCLLDMVEHNTTLTLEEVGDALGLTRERVRQIEQRALLKLRNLAAHRPDLAQVIRELAGGFK